MKNFPTMRLGLLAAVLGLTAGCQNQVTVRVERVVLDPEAATLQRDSRLGRTVELALTSLDELSQAYDSILVACKEDAKTEQFLEAVTRKVQDQQAATRKRIEALEDLFRGEDASAGDIRWELCRTGVFFGQYSRFASDLKEALATVVENLAKDNPMRQNLGNIRAKVLPQAVKTAEVAGAAETRTNQAMFGGFCSSDVYEINASDPVYRRILGASPAKHSRACVTRVDAGATGDSTIMIVMESPCQFRLYQISNDPTRIVQNLSLITQKVLAAALRFAVGA